MQAYERRATLLSIISVLSHFVEFIFRLAPLILFLVLGA